MTDSQTYSVFWHQHTRQKFNGPAMFITNTVLALKSGTVVARYTNLVLTFVISGFMHGVTDVAAGIPWRSSGAFRFFCTQALGIMLEDGIQALYRCARGTQRTSEPPSRWIRMAGYGWVLAFVVWSTPSWFYPLLRTVTREPKYKALPVSAMSFLRDQLT